MPTAISTVVIRKSPEKVFDYLADITRHGEWSPKAYKATALTDGPVGVGSKYRSVGWLPGDANHENEVEVTAYERPRRFSFTAMDRGQAFKSDFTLTPTDSGTKVERVTVMPKPPGFVGVVFPVFFSLVVKPAVQKGMNMFRDKAEAQA
jgi:uncharacterized protein YndB with AHSA1/START domain